ncbi:MAG: RnfABCDGE type electron transport complex subunit B [Betaproteobacteria bacterium]
MNRTNISAETVDALLPQTQCGKCGHPGCRPYAEAVTRGRADINRCPPGGDELIRALAALLDVPYRPLDPAFGSHRPPAVALIDEAACIGCTLCIQVCPVDAIVGAAKFMHTVIAHECTGCELCLPPCPVDCIVMQPQPAAQTPASRQLGAARARRRYEARAARLLREGGARAARLAASRAAAEERKRATIQRAVARAQARLQQRGR